MRAFVDFLVERLNFDADYMQELCPNRRRLEAAEHSPAPVYSERGAEVDVLTEAEVA